MSFFKRLLGQPDNPDVTWKPGDKILIVKGALTDVTGTIEEVDYRRRKVKVRVVLAGLAAQAEELRFSDIESDSGDAL